MQSAAHYVCACVLWGVQLGVHTQTSVLRGAMGNDVARAEPGISVTLGHIITSSCMHTQARTAEDCGAQAAPLT